jgi:lysine 2,3-aminomutase
MKERITPYLRTLIEHGSTAIRLQFKKPRRSARKVRFGDDPLGEEARFSPMKGLVHKFGNRVLWKVSYRCAAHCLFCTRYRQIGTPGGDQTPEDIAAGAAYVREHAEIDDVILSGGDPLFTPLAALSILNELEKIETVKVIRIGTRLPIHAPDSFRRNVNIAAVLRKMRLLAKEREVFILVHVNHPDELTRKALHAIATIRRTGASLASQTVFLRGVNDDVETLTRLFTMLYHNGVRPYYLYRCDYVGGIERFICPFRKEQRIVTELRRRLSGLAFPTYVIDAPGGRGKVPPPLDFWGSVHGRSFRDFDGKQVRI